MTSLRAGASNTCAESGTYAFPVLPLVEEVLLSLDSLTWTMGGLLGTATRSPSSKGGISYVSPSKSNSDACTSCCDAESMDASASSGDDETAEEDEARGVVDDDDAAEVCIE